MTSRKWVIGNWKLNGSLASNQALMAGIRAKLPVLHENVGMAVCPAFPYLSQLAALTQDSGIELGAQNLSEQSKGAYTGEVAGTMLKEFGIRFAIVGHSERRLHQQEDDVLIAKKTRAALDAGLIPVICLGETQQERDTNQTWAVLLRQLDTVFDVIKPKQDQVILAYEPRWAIGTGVSATPEMIEDVHSFLRTYLTAQDTEFGADTPILYGGSMNGSNAARIAAIKNVDGGLIGSASLNADEFVSIYQALAATID